MMGVYRRNARDQQAPDRSWVCGECREEQHGTEPIEMEGWSLRGTLWVCSAKCKADVEEDRWRVENREEDRSYINENRPDVAPCAEVVRSNGKWLATAWGCRGTGKTPKDAMDALALAVATSEGEIDKEQREQERWPLPRSGAPNTRRGKPWLHID